MNQVTTAPRPETGEVAQLLQRLEQEFAGMRKENPPDGWPEESEHVSFLVLSLELLRLVGVVVLVLLGVFGTDGTEVVILLVALGLLEGGYRLVRPLDRPLRKKLYRKGRFLHAALVQGNPQAFDPELDEAVPGTVVYSFDAQLGTDPEALNAVASRLYSLREQDRSDMPEEVGALAWRLYHEMCPNPRQAVPASLGGAPGTWVADVTIHPGDRFTALGGLALLALPAGDHWAGTQLVPGAFLDRAGV